jgi:PAS domain S-box-containing protein
MNVRVEPASAPRRGVRRRGNAADDFRLMADCAPVMIWVSGPDRKCVYVNRPWLEFTGRTLEEALDRGWSQGIHPEDRDRVLGVHERAFSAIEPFELEYRLRRRDGWYRWLLDKGVPVVVDGELNGFIGSCLDITDRMLAEKSAAELLERERMARASAESATLARDQFLAIVSHELRSPLNGIRSWTHVLQSQLRDADPTVIRALNGIMIGVEHQVRLIEDLLDVTRAMSGNLGLAKQAMALLPVLAEAVESLRASALEKGLHIVTDYGIGDREIHGDADRVRQIFVNLITNAIKFTPAGGTIRVSAGTEAAMARVEIGDTGAGIPPEFLPYLFDPFRQADQGSSRRSQEGLGLGLALVRRLAELHGGYATCESAGVNRGSTFRVYLPLLSGTGRRVTVERAGGASVSSLPSLSGIRVLLIDDQREARESLATLLTQAGAGVTAAASCQEALAHLAVGEEHEQPQVIVCDIAMPGEDGYATLKRIRAWEATRGGGRPMRPAVALSAYAQREDRMRALAEGFQMHLTKPVAPAELIIVLSRVVRGMRI